MADTMDVHCRRQTTIVYLNSRDTVLHDDSAPLAVNCLAVR
jgi:hypothetical protein